MCVSEKGMKNYVCKSEGAYKTGYIDGGGGIVHVCPGDTEYERYGEILPAVSFQYEGSPLC